MTSDFLIWGAGATGACAIALYCWNGWRREKRRAAGREKELIALRRSEEEARERADRSSAILEHMPVMMNAVDEAGLFVVWNKECERVSGFSAEEMLGNPEALARLYPDEEYRAEVQADARSRDLDYRDWERHYATKDGGTRVLSTASISRKVPVPGWGAWGMAIDITDRVRAQEELEKGAKRLRLITDALPVLIAFIDSEGRYQFCNKTYEDWFGLRPEAILGRPLAAVLGEKVGEDLRPQIERTLEGEEHGYELLLRDGPGAGRWISAIHVPHLETSADGETSVDGFYSLINDISEAKRAEREHERLEIQLRQSQKMEAVGQLASGVAHDFRNLLTVISAHTERVKAEVRDNRSVLESVETMEQAVSQAATVTRSLLTFSRKLATVKRPISLCQAVRDMARMLHRTMPASIELEIDAQCRPEPWINADETQLQQVILNLALNARDAMPDGGVLRIRVSAHRVGPHPGQEESTDVARLVVEDSGEGMGEELVPRIFEPFFTTKSLDHGSGLGLATVHGIVEEHGAKIEVHSSVGEGTTFVIEFERIAEQPSSADEVTQSGSREGAGEAILLAEDNDQIRQIVAATLESGGYEVIAVPNGEALAEAIQREGARFKLLLMDVDLPRRSGMDVLAEIREAGDETPALLMTANTEVALPPGEEDPFRTTILLKPFKMSELMNRVGALMQPAD